MLTYLPQSITATQTLTPSQKILDSLDDTAPRLTPTIAVSATVSATSTTPPLSGLAASGAVLLNEIVTDPQQDWSSHDFNGIIGSGTVSQGVDEFVELFIRADGLDLTGWTIELLDGSDVVGGLQAGQAFQTSRYVGAGQLSNTQQGDYLVLGNVVSSKAINNIALIQLRDETGQLIDAVSLGQNGAPDGSSNGGNATSANDEAIFRFPNGTDTDNDLADFIAGSVTLGSANGQVVSPTPTMTRRIQKIIYQRRQKNSLLTKRPTPLIHQLT
ncbi:hypothetical protein QUF63_10000 [Anaerolineales bacterium HSG25]|nr:hypothetical protein [Anaerolineales bacterium HSG25]